MLRPPTSGDELATRIIEIEPLVLAVPADHRLASEPTVAMADLRAESFVVYADSHSAVNEAVVRSCKAAGFAPHQEHAAPGSAVLLALVSAGLGVALVPASVRAARWRGWPSATWWTPRRSSSHPGTRVGRSPSAQAGS